MRADGAEGRVRGLMLSKTRQTLPIVPNQAIEAGGS
jgi:hypothetical protein